LPALNSQVSPKRSTHEPLRTNGASCTCPETTKSGWYWPIQPSSAASPKCRCPDQLIGELEGGADDLGPLLVFRLVALFEPLGQPQQGLGELLVELRVLLLVLADFGRVRGRGLRLARGLGLGAGRPGRGQGEQADRGRQQRGHQSRHPTSHGATSRTKGLKPLRAANILFDGTLGRN
jgi:hypothetical protein